MNPRKTSIRSKLTITLVALVLLTTSAMNWLAFDYSRGLLLDQIHAHLDTIAHDRAARIQAFIERQHERVQLVSSRTRLRKYLADALDH